MMNVQEAWEKRCQLWKKGTTQIEKAKELKNQAALIPVNSRISFWLMGSELHAEAYDLEAAGYQNRMEGDRLFYDVLLASDFCTPNDVVSWTWVEEKKLHRCVVNVRTFEPV